MTTRSMATVVGLLMLCLTTQAASAQETASFESVNGENPGVLDANVPPPCK